MFEESTRKVCVLEAREQGSEGAREQGSEPRGVYHPQRICLHTNEEDEKLEQSDAGTFFNKYLH